MCIIDWTMATIRAFLLYIFYLKKSPPQWLMIWQSVNISAKLASWANWSALGWLLRFGPIAQRWADWSALGWLLSLGLIAQHWEDYSALGRLLSIGRITQRWEDYSALGWLLSIGRITQRWADCSALSWLLSVGTGSHWTKSGNQYFELQKYF